MKHLFIAILSLLAINVSAETSKPALDQIHSDLVVFITERGTPGLPKEQVDSAVSGMQSQIISQFPNAVTYTPDELSLLADNKSIVTDTLLESTYKHLKSLAGPRPMPVIVEFYKSKYDQKSLNSMQKAIYFRLTDAITKTTAEQGAAANP